MCLRIHLVCATRMLNAHVSLTRCDVMCGCVYLHTFMCTRRHLWIHANMPMWRWASSGMCLSVCLPILIHVYMKLHMYTHVVYCILYNIICGQHVAYTCLASLLPLLSLVLLFFSQQPLLSTFSLLLLSSRCCCCSWCVFVPSTSVAYCCCSTFLVSLLSAGCPDFTIVLMSSRAK